MWNLHVGMWLFFWLLGEQAELQQSWDIITETVFFSVCTRDTVPGHLLRPPPEVSHWVEAIYLTESYHYLVLCLHNLFDSKMVVCDSCWA